MNFVKEILDYLLSKYLALTMSYEAPYIPLLPSMHNENGVSVSFQKILFCNSFAMQLVAIH